MTTNAASQGATKDRRLLKVMAAFAGAVLFTVCFMRVIEVTGGGVIEPPDRNATLRAEWMPRLQEAAAHHREGTAIPAKVYVVRGDRHDLNDQLVNNIGPALGWQARYDSGGLLITLPVQDLEMLEDLQRSPEVFIEQHSSIPQRAELEGDLVNAQLEVKVKYDGDGVLSALGTGVGAMMAVLAIVHLAWPDPAPSKNAQGNGQPAGHRTPRRG